MKSNKYPDHQPRKRFGQNFLTDQHIIQKIVASIAAKPCDHLIEIGPGKGAITQWLLKVCPRLQVIELDRDLVPILLAQFACYDAFTIHREDALRVDFSHLAPPGQRLRVVGNLPYNISTPLIFHLLRFQDCIEDMHFMLQKEVVQRMAAAPGDKHYGRLSVMVQYYCQVQHLFPVPPQSFYPAPKVDSAIVRLNIYRKRPYDAQSVEHLSKLVNQVFQMRRKTLRNSLKHWLDDDTMAKLPVDIRLRPEKLSVADYVLLSNYLVNEQIHHKN